MATCASCGKEIHGDDWTCGQGTGAVVIKKHSGDFKVTMSGKDAAGTQKTYTIPAHLDGSSLARAVFESIIKDFRLVFTLQDPTHLEMKVEGTPVGGSVAAQDSRSSVVLVKDD